MKKNWFQLLVFFFFFFQLHAGIVKIDTLNQVKDELLHADTDSLVIFDVDYTLIIPRDAIMGPCAKDLRRQLQKEIIDNPEVTPQGKYAEGHLLSKVLLQSNASVIDPGSVSLIRELQSKQIRVIALTAAIGGPFGVLESAADRRIQELAQLEFSFKGAFPQLNTLKFPKDENKKFHPIFKEGVLFSSQHPKGKVLRQFLEIAKWRPAKVFFLDDSVDYLQSVEQAMQEIGIPFSGFHYTAAYTLRCNLDPEIAALQYRHLAEHGEWLSDLEAKLLLQQNHVK